jgi:two-component system, OmpR family, response regulator
MTSLQDILYIEDDPDIQEIAKLALEAIGGFQVRVCDSCQQALEEIKQCKPQLILLDVMMPGNDGPSTLQILRQIDGVKNIPVVFITAKVQKHEVESYLAIGAQGVITKPFDPMTLADTVKNLWAKCER